MSGKEDESWVDVGEVTALSKQCLQEVSVGRRRVALSYVDGTFSAISGVCNHVGGPLGKGTIDEGGYVTCPWHYWKYHRATGEGEPGFEGDCVPVHEVRIENGRVLISYRPSTKRGRLPHDPHPLSKVLARGDPGGAPLDAPWRVLGISTTNMDERQPRFSTSEHLLRGALEHAGKRGFETRMVRLSALSFRGCEGFYSKSARACTWPCSITQMDPKDQLETVYEGFVQWADITLVATPIRWGAPSALYQKMAERMNCIQNQVTIAKKVLLRNKVAGFIITGGQDNVQGVAGQLMNFFGELGCHFPQFPYVAHSRGWSAEDMENNISVVATSEALAAGCAELVDRCALLAERLHQRPDAGPHSVSRGGRKGQALG